MKWLMLVVFVLVLLAGCSGQANVSIAIMGPADLTATSVAVPPLTPNSTGYMATPDGTPDPNDCTAYNAIGVNVYLRNFPGEQHDLIATWLPGVPLEVLGRSDAGWYLLRIPPNGRAWADEKVVRQVGTCDTLPMLSGANLRVADYKLPCRVSSATGNIVSLYNLPSFDSQVTGELPQAYLMEAVQRTAGGWYYVRDFLEMLPTAWDQGWVYESNLHRNGSCDLTAMEPPAQGAIISSSGEVIPVGCAALNSGAERISIFQNADINSQLLSWMYPQETARLTLRNPGGWFMIEYDSFRGWVESDRVEISGDCSSLPDSP